MAQQGDTTSMDEYKDSFFKMASSAFNASKTGWTRAKQVLNIFFSSITFLLSTTIKFCFGFKFSWEEVLIYYKKQQLFLSYF